MMPKILTIICLFLAIAIGWSSGTRVALALCIPENACDGHDGDVTGPMATHHCDYDDCCDCIAGSDGYCVAGYCRYEICPSCTKGFPPGTGYLCTDANYEACTLSQSVLCCGCCPK
jgi:hypothetical protein